MVKAARQRAAVEVKVQSVCVCVQMSHHEMSLGAVDARVCPAAQGRAAVTPR